MIRRSPEMILAAYALSRLGVPGANGRDRPPAFLGVSRWNDAYDLFFPQWGEGRETASFRASLKNARDAFDAYGATPRTGWRNPDGTPPQPTGAIRRILEEWGHRSDNDLQRFVVRLLERNAADDPGKAIDTWPSVRARLERTTRATVGQSGKTQIRTLKNKELRCRDLERTLDDLMLRQGNRCAQTGVVFVEADTDLRASLDRIDSDGHYADGTMDDGLHNLQLVTHWYNMAKGIRTDEAMRRLLRLHGGGPASGQPTLHVSETLESQ